MVSVFLKILSSGLLDKLLDHYNNKDTHAAEVAKEHIKAEIETRKQQKELIVAEHGWWITRWQRPFLFYPCALHVLAIVFDTVFQMGLGVPSLPSPYNELQFAIILSYFLTRPVEKSVKYFKR